MTMLYRGVRVELGVDLALAQAGTTLETVGQELQLGPKVIEALSRSGGLGTHWSTRPEIAERFALESSGNGGGTPVLITVNWDGSGEDKERTNTGGTWADEAEVTILPGTPLQVVSVKLGSGFADGVEVLHSDRYLDYASDFQGAGLPVPQGGPRTVTASSDIIARGFGFDGVGFELAQKYMNGTMTGRDILQEIETKWGSVGIWWGSIGPTGDDFFGSASEARDYAGWSGDGSIEERWEDMLDLTGGQVDPSGWIEAEIRVVLIAKKPVRDYGIWNPTTENGEGSMWESTSFFEHGERLELVEVQYSFDGTTWKSEAAGGLTVTAHRTAKIHPYLQDLLNECETSETAGSDNAICEAFAGLPDYMIDTHPSANYLKSLQKEVASYETDNETYALVEELKSINRREINGFRTAGTRTDPGGVYRGINVQVLSHDEQEEVAAWANGNSFSMDDYQLAEPNYELVYRILDRLDSGGLGRHWSKDYDVSADFARDQGDGIELILIGHWEGEGVDQREFHRGWDGVQRPSNLPHEEEVTLYPGTPVTLVGMDIVTETGFTYNIPVPNIQVTASLTAAGEFKVLLRGPDNDIDLALEPDVDAPTMFFFDRLMETIKFVKEQQGRDLYYFDFDSDRGFVTTRLDSVKVYQQGQDKSDEFREFIGSRTAAEPGGVLPWNPSHRGYTWITKTDGTLEAVTNDGVNRMFLHEYPYGWEWEVFDSLGFVEGGTFGMALKGGDALRDRANDLLAEFDTRAERRTRGPSWGYQDDYSQAPNTLWSKREAWSNSPWADYDMLTHEKTASPQTLYRGIPLSPDKATSDRIQRSFEAGDFYTVGEEILRIVDRDTGAGTSWTTRDGVAVRFALSNDSWIPYGSFAVVLEGHWAGGNIDHSRDRDDDDTDRYEEFEDEVRLFAGDKVTVTKISVRAGTRAQDAESYMESLKWTTWDVHRTLTALNEKSVEKRKTTSQRYAERLRREGRR